MANLDIAALREQWVGKVFQEIDLEVDQDRMLEWARRTADGWVIEGR